MVLVHYEQGCNKASTCGPGLFTNTDSNSISASYAVRSKEIKVTCYYCKVAPRTRVCAVFCTCVFWREGFWKSCCQLLVWKKVQLGQSQFVSESLASKYFWYEEALGWTPARQSWVICFVSQSCWQVHPQGEGGLKTHVVPGGNAREEIPLTHCYSMLPWGGGINGFPVQLNSALKTPV